MRPREQAHSIKRGRTGVGCAQSCEVKSEMSRKIAAEVHVMRSLTAGMVLALMLMFIGFLIFSGLGGLLGAMLLRRRARP